MPYDFNVEQHVNDFKNLAKSKGIDEARIDAFIESKKPPKPTTPLSIGESGFIGNEEVKPEIPFLQKEEPTSTLPLISKPQQTEPELPFGQAADMEVPQQIPSLPTSPAGHDDPEADQQNIPVTPGTIKRVDFSRSVPEGTQFSPNDGANGLGGQCAWFAEQVTRMPDGDTWIIGDTINEKKKNLIRHVKEGNGFIKGQKQPVAGNSVIIDNGTRYGHVAVVNEVLPDGRLKLTESNWNNDLRVSHDRVVDQNDPTVLGFLETVPNTRSK